MRAIDPDESPWDAWSPHEVARPLASVGVPGYVAVAWAIEEILPPLDGLEVFVITRPHETGGRRWFLFHVRHARQDKTQRDLAVTPPRLDSQRQAWLRHALETVHPCHPWVADLERSAA